MLINAYKFTEGYMKCCGCGVCASICPMKCIKMQRDNEGFFRPIKVSDKCANCGLCEVVCPQKNVSGCSLDEMKLYSAYSRNKDIRSSTSSGGVAFQMAKYAISKKMIVCGVMYDVNSHEAKHITCSDLKGIDSLKGSKYLQSNSSNGFVEVIDRLKNTRDSKAIIFGTPCQIVGLSIALEKLGLRNRVTLVDIYCHGVPSYNLWLTYLKSIGDKYHLKSMEDIKQVIFRDKQLSWHKYYMNIRGEDWEYISPVYKDLFLRLFTMGVVNQRSCFDCHYRNLTQADVRLGDYWGKRYQHNDDGYSMILVNSKNGENLLNDIKSELVIEQYDISERFGQSSKNHEFPKYYDRTMTLLREQKDMQSIINLYEPHLLRYKRELKRIILKLRGIK